MRKRPARAQREGLCGSSALLAARVGDERRTVNWALRSAAVGSRSFCDAGDSMDEARVGLQLSPFAPGPTRRP